MNNVENSAEYQPKQTNIPNSQWNNQNGFFVLISKETEKNKKKSTFEMSVFSEDQENTVIKILFAEDIQRSMPETSVSGS